MKRRSVTGIGLVVRSVAMIAMMCGVLALMAPGSAVAAPGSNLGTGPGCVAGGYGYVGPVPAAPESGGEVAHLNWHGSYIVSLCPGATGPQEGDYSVQTKTYADGTTESYKIVFTSQNLVDSGAFCYWDLDTDGYHCPDGADDGHLYWWIVSSYGDSPYLEPHGGNTSSPNGIGVYI